MKYTSENRAFASFSGICPYRCNHCYTFIDEFVSKGKDNIESIIDSLKGKDFEIVYVSGYRENFIKPSEGILLLERLYKEFGCDILLTTRAVFEQEFINRISTLNSEMKKNGNNLFLCISIPAYESYELLEPSKLIPSPEMRMDFLKKIHIEGIYTILTIRPLCPDSFIPTAETLKIINNVKSHCSAVISSGIVVNDYILDKLESFPTNFSYTESNIMNCLDNKIPVKYVDVEHELDTIEKHCKDLNIPFFKNSLPAINYLYDRDNS